MGKKWGSLVVAVALLSVPISVFAQSFAYPAALVQVKAWLFTGPGKAAKLGKFTFELPAGELDRQSAGAARAGILPVYAFTAVNTNTLTFLNTAIRKCKMVVAGAGRRVAACQKFTQNVQGTLVVGWIAAVANPIFTSSQLKATVRRRGGTNSPAGAAAVDAGVWVNAQVLAADPEQMQEAIVEIAANQLYAEVQRLAREGGLER